MGISEIRVKSNRFVANLNIHIAQAIEKNEELIVDLNRKQMLKFKKADGSTITPPYSEKYANMKGFSNPNLYLEGDFQGDMFLAVNENKGEFFIGSFDPKTVSLIERYSEGIFGVPRGKEPVAQKAVQRDLARDYNKTVLNA